MGIYQRMRWMLGPAILTPEVVLAAVALIGGMLLVGGFEDRDAASSACDAIRGHTSLVSSVVFAPDGRSLASGSWDQTVKVWEFSGEPSSGLTLVSGSRAAESNPDAIVYSLGYSVDGRTLAVGGFASEVDLWDASTMRRTKRLRGHRDLVRCVQFSPDGRLLASGSADATVRLWDVGTGAARATLVGHAARVSSLAFAKDGHTLATASYDGTVRLWDPATGRETGCLEQGMVVDCLALSPDGRTLAVGGHLRGLIRLWDLRLRQEVVRYSASLDGGVTALAYSPEGQMLASGAGDGMVKLWDAATGQTLATFPGHPGLVKSVTFAPDGSKLAWGDDDGCILVRRLGPRGSP